MNKLSCLLLITSVASGSFVFGQDFNQDFSGDNTAPTSLGSFTSSFSVTGQIVDARGANPDVDVFTFNIANGFQLSAITLDGFTSGDNVAFLAIDDATSFPFNTADLDSGPDQSQFIGGLLFGDEGDGADLLPLLGNGAIGAGFTGPLAAGDYTIYAQQLGGTVVDYSLGFDVTAVPEPSAYGLMLSSLVLGLVFVRRRR